MQLLESDVVHRLALLSVDDARLCDYLLAVRVQIDEQGIVRQLVTQSGKR